MQWEEVHEDLLIRTGFRNEAVERESSTRWGLKSLPGVKGRLDVIAFPVNIGHHKENMMTKSTMHKSQAFSVVAMTGVDGEDASSYGQKVEPALAVV